MKDYVKPRLRDKNPDHKTMRVGTNDLNFKNNPERAAKSIVHLLKGMVSEKRLQFLESYPEMTDGTKRQKK